MKNDDGVWQWRFAPPKTEAGIRSTAIPNFMVEPLRAWLAALQMRGADGLVFPGQDGRSPIQASVLFGAHMKGREAIGHDDLRVHDLRRTAATLAAQGVRRCRSCSGCWGIRRFRW